MKELTVEALDRWAAEELMGWRELDYWWVKDVAPCGLWLNGCIEHQIFISKWSPSLPDSPAWQLLAIIEAMREKGLYIDIDNSWEEPNWQVEYATKRQVESGGITSVGVDPILMIAILKAAYVAYQKEGK